jgi:hypothetical protein
MDHPGGAALRGYVYGYDFRCRKQVRRPYGISVDTLYSHHSRLWGIHGGILHNLRAYEDV